MQLCDFVISFRGQFCYSVSFVILFWGCRLAKVHNRRELLPPHGGRNANGIWTYLDVVLWDGKEACGYHRRTVCNHQGSECGSCGLPPGVRQGGVREEGIRISCVRQGQDKRRRSCLGRWRSWALHARPSLKSTRLSPEAEDIVQKQRNARDAARVPEAVVSPWHRPCRPRR